MSETELKARFTALKKRLLDKIYGRLNDMQREAVFAPAGPLLILAGAGSGKTTVVVNKIACLLRYGDAYSADYLPEGLTEADLSEMEASLSGKITDRVDRLLRHNPADGKSVLAITFTNKAAGELRDRIAAASPSARDVTASTFHSFCAGLLRVEIEKLGYSRAFTIYDAEDVKSLLKSTIKDLGLNDREITPKMVAAMISKAKNGGETLKDVLKRSEYNLYTDDLIKISERYDEEMKKANALDFDDLLLKTVELFRKSPETAAKYERRFKYLFVDEYQDTNLLQYEMLARICPKDGNITVVGDDDQSIYRFRGATIENILKFEERYKNARVIRLEQNYRSTKNILDAANALIKNNSERKGKNLWTSGEKGKPIVCHTASDSYEEAKYIAKTIEKTGGRYSDYAVLYRNNAQNRAISEALTRYGIPNRVIGGVRFYDRKEIKDVMSYLAVVANPSDDLRLRRIINEPSRKIGAASLARISEAAFSEGVPTFEILRKASEYPELSRAREGIEDFVSLIERLGELKTALPLSELFDKLLELSGYEEMLLADKDDEAKDRISNLYEFKSAIASYEAEHGDDVTLEGFLEEISLIADVDNLDPTADAVTLMTLHSAKGLEFPNVFIAGLEEGIFPSAASTFEQGGIEEERRLAYVGITRAKKRLWLLNAAKRMLYGYEQENPPSRFVGEIPESLLENEDDFVDLSRFRTFDDYAVRAYRREAATRKNVDFTFKETAPAEKKTVSFAAGDKVLHPSFGEGKVLTAEKMGNDMLLKIDFGGNIKKIMANYARMKKL